MNRSFEKRLAQSSPTQTFECLADETLSSFFESVSTLSERSYPKWMLNRIKEAYCVPNDPGFLSMLLTAQKMCEREDSWDSQAKKGDPPNLGGGFELMYQLLIEPFYLIGLHHQ